MRMRTLVFSMVLLGVFGVAAAQASAHTLSPSSHNFGNIVGGNPSAVKVFTVTATGTPYQVTGLTSSAPDFRLVDDGDASACGTVNAGSSCTFGVLMQAFSPGAKSATITVTGIGGNLTATVTGNSVSPAKKKKKCKKKKGGRSAVAAKKCKKR